MPTKYPSEPRSGPKQNKHQRKHTRPNFRGTKSEHSLHLSSKLGISQQNPGKQVENKILISKFFNVPDPKVELLQRVRFWTKTFRRHHSLNWWNYSVTDFRRMVLKRRKIWKKKRVCIHKNTNWTFSLCENDIFLQILCFFKKLEFELKTWQRVRFWIVKTTTHKFFDSKNFRFRFWNKNSRQNQDWILIKSRHIHFSQGSPPHHKELLQPKVTSTTGL